MKTFSQFLAEGQFFKPDADTHRQNRDESGAVPTHDVTKMSPDELGAYYGHHEFRSYNDHKFPSKGSSAHQAEMDKVEAEWDKRGLPRHPVSGVLQSKGYTNTKANPKYD